MTVARPILHHEVLPHEVEFLGKIHERYRSLGGKGPIPTPWNVDPFDFRTGAKRLGIDLHPEWDSRTKRLEVLSQEDTRPRRVVWLTTPIPNSQMRGVDQMCDLVAKECELWGLPTPSPEAPFGSMSTHMALVAGLYAQTRIRFPGDFEIATDTLVNFMVLGEKKPCRLCIGGFRSDGLNFRVWNGGPLNIVRCSLVIELPQAEATSLSLAV